jgi:uncharacterized protein
MSLISRALGHRFKLPRAVTRKVAVERDIPVPMRDGVTLCADRWYARGYENAPVVLMRSPYGRGAVFGQMGRLFAERGFQLVLQSVRGTAGSGGTLRPFQQEHADGLDTLQWLRAQPWWSGHLYTFGMSYLGYAQWAMADETGHGIDAMALHVTLSNFKNETLAFGGFTLEGSLSWTRTMALLGGELPVWRQLMASRSKIKEELFNHLPLVELDRLATGREVPWWRDWLAHSDPSDPWWQPVDHSRRAAAIDAPVAMIGGWRDIFLPWQVSDFAAMQGAGRDAWLTIGPWNHTSTDGMAESLRQGIALFSAHTQGMRPFADRDRVRLYVTGANQWRDYPCWPPPGSREQRLYLQPGATLSTLPPASACAPTAYVYDPAHPTPAVHGPRLFEYTETPDMSALERRSDTVSFTSAALAEDTEIIGHVGAELFIRSSAVSADFYVCLCDVDEVGRPLQIVDGYVRLRPRDASPDEYGIRRAAVSCWPTAYRIRRGHRIRLIIASGAHPRYARNLGADEPIGSATHMVSALQEIFHHPASCSMLALTVSMPIAFVST